MNEISVDARLHALVQRRIELAHFTDEVNDNIADGFPLHVKDRAGEYPVVVALGQEPISLLIENLALEPDGANVFVKDDAGTVTYFTSQWGEGDGRAVDMGDENAWANGNSPVSLLVELLKKHPEGVIIPGHLTNTGSGVLNAVRRSAGSEWKAESALV